jgi:hypothetical protein
MEVRFTCLEALVMSMVAHVKFNICISSKVKGWEDSLFFSLNLKYQPKIFLSSKIFWPISPICGDVDSFKNHVFQAINRIVLRFQV